jgi:tRNA G18 (ribose-2'-O)-methylase SpoU
VPRLPVDEPDDPLVAEFVGLREKPLSQGRRPADPTQAVPGAGRLGVFVAEGDVVVARALGAGYRLRSVLVDATRRDPLPTEVPPDAVVYAASPAVLQRITGLGVHRGVLASFDRRPVPPAGDVLTGARRVLVLERVSNPTNLGVILRTARGLGVDAALLDPTCTDPLYRRVSRVAMGESYALPYAWLDRLPGGLDVLQAAAFRLVALTPGPDAIDLAALRFRPEEKVALLLGAEGPGLSQGSLAAADVRAAIPMHAGVDSLNVGVAAGIACWALTHSTKI